MVGALNFAWGWVGILLRVLQMRPGPSTEILVALGILLAMLPLNVRSAMLYAGYAGPGSRIHWRVLAAYEAAGLLGLGCAWVAVHAP